ncbi:MULTISPECIES: 2-oxoglutarate dehydrogenase, E2 component, dihydrolipoamide succinyltransferase [Micromonospora]|uniref:Dihydrolipoamide acetyltransferase component of pyruvate dehydrogenase complex n=1 Tax=Micromonospora solifontis TaxID=2487138 RepID=A0ABX9WI56_9ACTN|nr:MULTISPECIES: 2-oxoglutarate dehydrogenase, E2 component, dihydrolipoamide succinyltransferase [Micromonospora]NES12387.1 2-oxoglutarate dehydrogenase, E2 component, dihydrolipoamide succinyltransferase [Micromonospora sp. PPF5-17B]NES37161.1 2-oxoglutarate dehydrogenase, E2 component, dihydrolipoamide succinyltransferase [Micromonospora solifontis]NES54130.1 2-oxoglutarate dehydrogenase, E2 component, dihydrolipoamide succinyltransferase [Micromonospora sp. PPF5-6]RNL98713.1 2-oxoglutarate 
MPVSVTMPRLGESVTEGTVTRWLKQEGDTVEVDEPLLEVSTDKVDTEIPSPAAGVLSRIVVGEDETAEVGSELAVIAGEGEEAGGAAPQQEAPAEQAAEAAAEPQAEAEQPAVQEPAPAAAPSGEGTEVKMPALGESVTEGTVTRWLKQVGETVEVDEPLLEVSTDKVDTEIPSPVAGTLLEIKVAEDETAEVGGVLAIVGAAGAAPAQPKPEPKAEAKPEPKPAPEPKVEEPTPGVSYNEPAAEAEQAAQPAKVEQAAQPAAPTPTPQRPTAPVQGGGEEAAGYVTPLVRKLAAEHGVDLSSVNGTGVGGRIRKQDVLEAAERAKAAKAAPAAQPAAAAPAAKAPAQPAAKPQPSAKRGSTEKLPRIRAAIAKRMQQSLHEMAQLTTVIEVDVTRIAKLRAQAKDSFQQRHGVKLSFLPFFALAAIEALQTYPIVNASMDLEAGTITYPDAEHLGIAVDTERGLLVPVIHNAGDLNLGGIAKRVADLAERTRINKISPDEIAGATFTLTNTGSRGALFDTPIVPSPQSAMLGTGAVVKRPVVVNDPELGEVVAIRSMVYLALSYDHRLIDGADAARFLVAVKERLEAGNFEAELGL